MQNSQQNAAATNASLSKALKNNSANASAANVSIKYQKVSEKGVYCKPKFNFIDIFAYYYIYLCCSVCFIMQTYSNLCIGITSNRTLHLLLPLPLSLYRLRILETETYNYLYFACSPNAIYPFSSIRHLGMCTKQRLSLKK